MFRYICFKNILVRVKQGIEVSLGWGMDVNYSGMIENEDMIEKLFEVYLKEPQKLDQSWRKLFAHVEAEPVKKKYVQEPSNVRIEKLKEAYRNFGHLLSDVNPLKSAPQNVPQELELSNFGFSPSDLSVEFPTEGLLPKSKATLEEILRRLKEIYCAKIGYEYAQIENPELVAWIQKRIEMQSSIQIPVEQKKMILECLNKSELLESFLQTKYTGQKRFSLEGGETLIPILETIIERGVELGLSEFVLGMAHRGRLNVLSNIMRKSHAELFAEFSEDYIPEAFEGTGDVKYHKGFFSEIIALNGQNIKITLSPNPSHLESVDAVVEGQTYAKQLLAGDQNKEMILPILIHGDAAIAGQGVVYETLQLSRLKNYDTGGTVHLIINNQIGFTTLPSDAKSTRYCTDIAKAFNAPVFHVNAEDPEACIFIANLAIEIRQKFHCEVFIDLNCYRKYGHNETDEPAFTQPLDYQVIRKKRPIRELYRDELIQQGVVEKEIAESLEVEFKNNLQKALDLSKAKFKSEEKKADDKPKKNEEDVTCVSKETLQMLAEKISQIPSGFSLHSKLTALIKDRQKMTFEGEDAKPMDWGMAETLAYASLLAEGIDVRLAGQDSCRGTFSHRHGIWVDQSLEKEYFPLKHIQENQGVFQLINSPLSEFAALGFEYGYSVANPNALVIWEAQFGDFSNGAQVIIDQFISTGQQKWNQKSSLALFLPHGYEGQGPEHSSARIERFLALAGHDNMRIAYPTTPAQMFHLIRKQIIRKHKKPLIVFTPKGLLRHSKCVSTLNDLSKGRFLKIFDDPHPPQKVEQLVFCTGRIYYDLEAKREELQHPTAIVRIEKLYPLDLQGLDEIIKKYQSASKVIWVQEEPYNMGAWSYMEPFLHKALPPALRVEYVGRERGASPAVGSHAMHKKELEMILKAVFNG